MSLEISHWQWVVWVGTASRRLRVLENYQQVVFDIYRETYITAPTSPFQSDMECVLRAALQKLLDPQHSPGLGYLLARAWQHRSLRHGSSTAALTLLSFAGRVSALISNELVQKST